MKSSNRLRCPASTPCCARGVLDGSAMSIVWQTGGFPRTCCMDSLLLAPGHLRFKDVCKRDMKSMGIGVDTWEDSANDRASWRQSIWKGIEKSETLLSQAAAERRARRKAPQSASAGNSSMFTCNHCQRDCHSQVGLYSHTKKCSLSTT